MKSLLQTTTVKVTIIILIIGTISLLFLLWQKNILSQKIIKQQSLYDTFKKTYSDYSAINIKTDQIMSEEQTKIVKKMLTQDTIIEFITYIENKAEKESIPLELKSDGAESMTSEQQKVSYSLNFQADLPKTLNFIKLLEQEMPYLSSIESFSFTNPEKEAKIDNVQIKLTIYLK